MTAVNSARIAATQALSWQDVGEFGNRARVPLECRASATTGMQASGFRSGLGPYYCDCDLTHATTSGLLVALGETPQETDVY